MTIELAGSTEARIAELIAAGDFPNAQAVVDAALALYFAREHGGYGDDELDEIDLAVAAGEREADQGKGRLVSDIIAELQARHAVRS